MAGVRLFVSGLSDVGRARETNEDAFEITDLENGQAIDADRVARYIDVADHGVLLALSDGMGGRQAGEVASALVLESLRTALSDPEQKSVKDKLEDAVLRANRAVLNTAKIAQNHGMAATLTAVLVHGTEAYITEVGDSRAYLLREGRLRQITRDQSLVQLMVDSGAMTPAEAKRSPNRNVVLQAVGLKNELRVAIARLALRAKDRFLLCSDGVTNLVSDGELRDIMTDSDPRMACETMIALANERGGDDNETAIVADVSGDALAIADEFESVTSTYEVLQAYDAMKRR
ncbi:MAG: serine/threonine-protein phosphatase [Deltaproteobacteria bacterium]|nr:serine/threonine-protein phosphatase [Deltaproteobacteria bacterium]MDQ3300814.1 protein phosphatase 2C domain-containing protein [Myxococcota bacterium]